MAQFNTPGFFFSLLLHTLELYATGMYIYFRFVYSVYRKINLVNYGNSGCEMICVWDWPLS